MLSGKEQVNLMKALKIGGCFALGAGLAEALIFGFNVTSFAPAFLIGTVCGSGGMFGGIWWADS